MIKVKLSPKLKACLPQSLVETEPYSIVLCESFEQQEPGKINIIVDETSIHLLEPLISFHAPQSERIACLSERGEELIPIAQLYYLESFGNDIYANTSSRSLACKSKLYQLEQQLSHMGFVRVSKSVVVNLAHVVAIKRIYNGKMQLTLANDITIEVNRSFVKAFKQAMERK
ncbi:MAG: LytTR family DNA-binding domain-containing protein [Erysipelotrichaceae bacterium]